MSTRYRLIRRRRVLGQQEELRRRGVFRGRIKAETGPRPGRSGGLETDPGACRTGAWNIRLGPAWTPAREARVALSRLRIRGSRSPAPQGLTGRD